MRRTVAAVGFFAVTVAWLLASSPFPAGAQSQSYLTGEVDALSNETAKQVEADLESFRQRTSTPLSILLVKTTGDTTIENYASHQPTTSGPLLVMAIRDHTAQIQNSGALTDPQRIEDDVVARLKANDPNEAVLTAEYAMRRQLGDTQASTPISVNATNDDSGATGWWWLVLLIPLIGSIAYFSKRDDSYSNPNILYGSTKGWDDGTSQTSVVGEFAGGGASGIW